VPGDGLRRAAAGVVQSVVSCGSRHRSWLGMVAARDLVGSVHVSFYDLALSTSGLPCKYNITQITTGHFVNVYITSTEIGKFVDFYTQNYWLH
jgi:hypothetical protein